MEPGAWFSGCGSARGTLMGRSRHSLLDQGPHTPGTQGLAHCRCSARACHGLRGSVVAPSLGTTISRLKPS